MRNLIMCPTENWLYDAQNSPENWNPFKTVVPHQRACGISEQDWDCSGGSERMEENRKKLFLIRTDWKCWCGKTAESYSFVKREKRPQFSYCYFNIRKQTLIIMNVDEILFTGSSINLNFVIKTKMSTQLLDSSYEILKWELQLWLNRNID